MVYKKGTSHGNANALSRRQNETEPKILTAYKSTQTDTHFVDFNPAASICELRTTPKEKLVKDQSEDKDFKDIRNYLINRNLPENTKVARKITIEVQDYTLEDDVLFHLWHQKGKGHRADIIVKQLS